MLPSLALFAQASSAPFKRSQLGLFHGKSIRFGNNVPFSKHKTRRTWLPNIQNKDLRSNILDKTLNIKLSTKALRTIRKHGGLDRYVLKTRHELLGYEGMRIRMMLREVLDKRAEVKAESVQSAKRAKEQAKEQAWKAKLAAEIARVEEKERIVESLTKKRLHALTRPRAYVRAPPRVPALSRPRDRTKAFSWRSRQLRSRRR